MHLQVYQMNVGNQQFWITKGLSLTSDNMADIKLLNLNGKIMFKVNRNKSVSVCLYKRFNQCL